MKLCVYLTNQDSEWTTAVVEVPSLSHRVTSVLERGETRKVNLPFDTEPMSDDLHNNTIIVTSNNGIAVYGFMYSGESAGGFMVLPTSVLGMDYFVASYDPAFDEWSQFAVTALEDDTEVVIEFRATINYKGRQYPPGGRIEKVLNRRESFLIKSQEDLTGTHVQSSKPISVVSGVSGAIIPSEWQTKDHMITHLAPTNTWGKTFTIPPIPGRRTGYHFRVIASCPFTTIDIPHLQTRPVLTKPGDFYECELQKSVLINSEKPVLVVQYAKSQAYREGNKPRDDGDGDTFMLVVPPWEAYLQRNTTFTGVQLIGMQSFRSHVSVTALCEHFRFIKLNGAYISAASGQYGSICTKQTLLSPLLSSFTISSAQPTKFLILVYGAALEISYAYPVGFTRYPNDCDWSLSNQANAVPNCCVDEYKAASSASYYSSLYFDNTDRQDGDDDNYYAGSSQLSESESESESDIGPSKSDMKMSSVPLNDFPGSGSSNDINPTADQAADDPAFVIRDRKPGDSSTCLKSGMLFEHFRMYVIHRTECLLKKMNVAFGRVVMVLPT